MRSLFIVAAAFGLLLMQTLWNLMRPVIFDVADVGNLLGIRLTGLEVACQVVLNALWPVTGWLRTPTFALWDASDIVGMHQPGNAVLATANASVL